MSGPICAMCGVCQEYTFLKSGTVIWACPHCDGPNCHTSLLDDQGYLRESLCPICNSKRVMSYEGTGPRTMEPPPPVPPTPPYGGGWPWRPR